MPMGSDTSGGDVTASWLVGPMAVGVSGAVPSVRSRPDGPSALALSGIPRTASVYAVT